MCDCIYCHIGFQLSRALENSSPQVLGGRTTTLTKPRYVAMARTALVYSEVHKSSEEMCNLKNGRMIFFSFCIFPMKLT